MNENTLYHTKIPGLSELFNHGKLIDKIDFLINNEDIRKNMGIRAKELI